MDKNRLDALISGFPVYQYAFAEPSALRFTEKTRKECREDCPYYKTSWACPPAVVKAEKCREVCLAYTDLLIFSTFYAVKDTEDGEFKPNAIRAHDELTRNIEAALRKEGLTVYGVSSGKCFRCQKCTFPRQLCRYPGEMHPCIESHGIVIPDVLPECGMDYYLGEDTLILFSLVFFRGSEENTAVKEEETE